MNLHGLLCWYDEPCADLAACVIGLHKAGVDHIIAVDGAYLLYPGGKASSPHHQAATIHQTARELGIATTIHTPRERWIGNEVEKRTRMFAIAHAASDPGDWWISMDADMVVTQAPHDLKQQLHETSLEAASCMLTDPPADNEPCPIAGHHPIRLLFKAQPLHCHIKHCAYRTPDGRYLWEPQTPALQEPAIDIPDLIVEHRDNQRTPQRHQDKATYYQRRTQYRAEQELAAA